MVISRSLTKTDDAKRIKKYWDVHKEESGGLLHSILEDLDVDDVNILWCLSLAMKDRDAEAIMICGYLLSISPDTIEKYISTILFLDVVDSFHH